MTSETVRLDRLPSAQPRRIAGLSVRGDRRHARVMLVLATAGWLTGCAATPSPIVAEDSGIAVSVSFDHADVAAGDSVKASVTVVNHRSDPAIVALNCGAPAVVSGLVPVPLAPEGRAWNGIAGDFKRYALTNGLGPGGVRATDPMVVRTIGPCPVDRLEETMAPGSSLTTSLTWKADLVVGLPAPAGTVQLAASVGHDPTGVAPSYPPDFQGPLSSWGKHYQQLVATGAVNVTGSGSRLVTLGEALDTMLADARFSAWLAEAPDASWTNVNAFLMAGTGGGIEPNGPAWDIELFRESTAHWAIGYVDPRTAKLLSVTFCNSGCQK